MPAEAVAAPILVGQLSAHGNNVAVISGGVDGNVVFGGQLRPPADYVRDFQELIEAATLGFVGRDRLFAELEKFRSAAGRGYFEIVADAGLGKTALAAEIVKRYRALCFFADASRGLTRAEQFLTYLCGEAITRYKMDCDYLPARAGEDLTYLERRLKEAAAKSAPVWVVVDGLDEADRPSDKANPLLLPKHLPQGVYFVVTHRPGIELQTLPDTSKVRYEIFRDAPDQQGAIEQYLTQCVSHDKQVKAALPDLRPSLGPEAFIARMKLASEGNFMYLSYVLADIVSPRDPGQEALDLDNLPQGLQGYYQQFWSTMEQAKAEEGRTEWNTLYRPIIERLAVAAEPVTADWLGAQIERPPQEVRETLSRWTRLLGKERIGERETWRVVHRSFSDFLADKVDLRSAHRAVAAHYTD